MLAQQRRKSRSQIALVKGEMCLWRIVPSPSTRNVSGAPVTPQSTAAFPSGSRPELTYARLPSFAEPLDSGRAVVSDVQAVDRHPGACELQKVAVLDGGIPRTTCPRRSRATRGPSATRRSPSARIGDGGQRERGGRLCRPAATARRFGFLPSPAIKEHADQHEDRQRHHVTPHDYAAPAAGCAATCWACLTAARYRLSVVATRTAERHQTRAEPQKPISGFTCRRRLKRCRRAARRARRTRRARRSCRSLPLSTGSRCTM